MEIVASRSITYTPAVPLCILFRNRSVTPSVGPLTLRPTAVTVRLICTYVRANKWKLVRRVATRHARDATRRPNQPACLPVPGPGAVRAEGPFPPEEASAVDEALARSIDARGHPRPWRATAETDARRAELAGTASALSRRRHALRSAKAIARELPRGTPWGCSGVRACLPTQPPPCRARKARVGVAASGGRAARGLHGSSAAVRRARPCDAPPNGASCCNWFDLDTWIGFTQVVLGACCWLAQLFVTRGPAAAMDACRGVAGVDKWRDSSPSPCVRACQPARVTRTPDTTNSNPLARSIFPVKSSCGSLSVGGTVLGCPRHFVNHSGSSSSSSYGDLTWLSLGHRRVISRNRLI